MSGGKRDYWEFFAEDALKTGSVLYSRLAAGIGKDQAMKALAARARKGQPHANVLLAAVHFLLLRGAEHALKRFYPSVGGTASADIDDPHPDFCDFVEKHRDTVLPLVETRVTNTNEVGRSALLHSGFRAIALKSGAPLSPIEIGPSAGLNLIWDRYGVRYLSDKVVRAWVGADARFVIDCELRGENVPPTGAAPKVESRIGLELNPVNLENPDDRDWLRALIWPDQVPRLERLDRAVALFAEAKPEIRVGDALDLLPDALAAVPRGAVPVVYHTITVYQFSRDMREALENSLVVAGLRRPVWRLSFEYDGAIYLLSTIRYADGTREETRLASCHPHGTWMEWLA